MLETLVESGGKLETIQIYLFIILFSYFYIYYSMIETLVESGGKLGTMQMQKQKLVEK